MNARASVDHGSPASASPRSRSPRPARAHRPAYGPPSRSRPPAAAASPAALGPPPGGAQRPFDQGVSYDLTWGSRARPARRSTDDISLIVPGRSRRARRMGPGSLRARHRDRDGVGPCRPKTSLIAPDNGPMARARPTAPVSRMAGRSKAAWTTRGPATSISPSRPSRLASPTAPTGQSVTPPRSSPEGRSVRPPSRSSAFGRTLAPPGPARLAPPARRPDGLRPPRHRRRRRRRTTRLAYPKWVARRRPHRPSPVGAHHPGRPAVRLAGKSSQKAPSISAPPPRPRLRPRRPRPPCPFGQQPAPFGNPNPRLGRPLPQDTDVRDGLAAACAAPSSSRPTTPGPARMKPRLARRARRRHAPRARRRGRRRASPTRSSRATRRSVRHTRVLATGRDMQTRVESASPRARAEVAENT